MFEMKRGVGFVVCLSVIIILALGFVSAFSFELKPWISNHLGIKNVLTGHVVDEACNDPEFYYGSSENEEYCEKSPQYTSYAVPDEGTSVDDFNPPETYAPEVPEPYAPAVDYANYDCHNEGPGFGSYDLYPGTCYWCTEDGSWQDSCNQYQQCVLDENGNGDCKDVNLNEDVENPIPSQTQTFEPSLAGDFVRLDVESQGDEIYRDLYTGEWYAVPADSDRGYDADGNYWVFNPNEKLNGYMKVIPGTFLNKNAVGSEATAGSDCYDQNTKKYYSIWDYDSSSCYLCVYAGNGGGIWRYQCDRLTQVCDYSGSGKGCISNSAQFPDETVDLPKFPKNPGSFKLTGVYPQNGDRQYQEVRTGEMVLTSSNPPTYIDENGNYLKLADIWPGHEEYIKIVSDSIETTNSAASESYVSSIKSFVNGWLETFQDWGNMLFSK